MHSAKHTTVSKADFKIIPSATVGHLLYEKEEFDVVRHRSSRIFLSIVAVIRNFLLIIHVKQFFFPYFCNN